MAAPASAALILGALLLFLGHGKKKGAGLVTLEKSFAASSRAVPKGGAVDIHHTSPGDSAEWARSRYQAAHDYLLSQSFADPQAHDIALSALAHWSLETNAGANEFNFNLGGIHARSGDQYFASSDAGNPTHFAAYDSLIESVQDYFGLLSAGYPSCWEKLKATPAESDWIDCLGKHGYYATTDKDGNPTHVPDAWATRRALLAQYAS